jgi:hypothetical protein
MSTILQHFIGFGLLLTVILVGICAGVMFYVPIWTSFMVINLKDYQYEVNAFSPADSVV